MTASAERLTIAFVISLLLHILILWLPGISLHRSLAPLPLLTVRLEAAPKRPPVPQMPPVAAPVKQEARKAIAPNRPVTTTAGTADFTAKKDFRAVDVAIPAAAQTGMTLPVLASTSYNNNGAPLLPLHAVLRFAVYLDGSLLPIGDMFQELDIRGNEYLLQTELAKAALGSLVSQYEIKQSSRGTLAPTGALVPDQYREELTTAGGEHRSRSATFRWAEQQVTFADGSSKPLPVGTQDPLSFMYELSRASFNTEVIPANLTDGTQLNSVRFGLGTFETIDTPMGKLVTMHLSQMHDSGEPWIEVWLGVNYRLLPVRFLRMNADGKVAEEMDIREIRSSDTP